MNNQRLEIDDDYIRENGVGIVQVVTSESPPYTYNRADLRFILLVLQEVPVKELAIAIPDTTPGPWREVPFEAKDYTALETIDGKAVALVTGWTSETKATYQTRAKRIVAARNLFL